MVNLSKEALKNKDNLLNKFFTIIATGNEYDFKIKHVNRNDIVIQRKFYFDELTSVDNIDSFESNIQKLITDSDIIIDNSEELRERSVINKDKLTRKMFTLLVGDRKQGFRVVHVTNKYIRIENILKYELIEKFYSKGVISLEYILHELILGNPVDYDLFKPYKPISSAKDILVDFTNDNSDENTHEEPANISIDVGDIKKLSDEELNSKASPLKRWQKLVFNAIDNFDEDIFTAEILEKQPIFEPYQFQGESLVEPIEENLAILVDLGLIKKHDEKHYIKLW